MGEFYVKASEGFSPFPVYQFADGEEIDFTGKPYTKIELPYDEFPIPSTNKYTLWDGGGGYLKVYGQNSNNNPWNVERSTLTGSNPSYTDTLYSWYNFSRGASVFIWAFTLPNGTFRIQAYPRAEADGLSQALRQINDGYDYNGNALYIGTWDEDSPLVEYIDDWDEQPSDNNDNIGNMNAIGGEFADRDRFDKTNNVSITDLEAMLDNIATLDYGGLIQPVILSQTEQLHNLSDLNEGLFLADFWTNLKNKFSGLSDPLSMILDTTELPYRPAGSGGNLKLGGIQVTNGQGGVIPVFKLTRRYMKKKVGSVTLKEVWGTEKDYSQCSVQIYLPYVGVRDIDTDLAINNTLTLYAVHDMWNGDILYILHCSNSASVYKYMVSEFVAYRWNGNCGKKVPLGRVDNTTPIMSLLSMARNTAVGFAGGGVVGALGMAGMGALNSNFNPTIQSSGNLSGSAGRMDIQYPYFILKRSVPAYPNNWRSEIGAPRYQEFQVSDLSGYTEFYEIHADDVSDATDSEKAEIENLLKSGVFIE